MAVCGALLAACGGGDGPSSTPVAVRTATTTPSVNDVAGDPGVTVQQAILACREKNAPLLRTFVSGEVTDEEIEALFARGRDVRLVAQREAQIEDGAAVVEVTIEVQRDDGVDTIALPWELERGPDGVWRFVALPDCY